MLVLLFMLQCPGFVYVNESGVKDAIRDAKALNRATKVCKVKYGTCLKRFTKKTEDTYWALCE